MLDQKITQTVDVLSIKPNPKGTPYQGDFVVTLKLPEYFNVLASSDKIDTLDIKNRISNLLFDNVDGKGGFRVRYFSNENTLVFNVTFGQLEKLLGYRDRKKRSFIQSVEKIISKKTKASRQELTDQYSKLLRRLTH